MIKNQNTHKAYRIRENTSKLQQKKEYKHQNSQKKISSINNEQKTSVGCLQVDDWGGVPETPAQYKLLLLFLLPTII